MKKLSYFPVWKHQPFEEVGQIFSLARRSFGFVFEVFLSECVGNCRIEAGAFLLPEMGAI